MELEFSLSELNKKIPRVHFNKTYIEFFPPAWILGELLPMGNVNIYYRNLKDKSSLITSFDLIMNV